jgi:GNAT superfamily N-acetyltransferase
MSKIEIIQCSIVDASELAEVAVRAYRDYYLYLWHDDGSWYINRSFSIEQFEKELKDPNAAFYLLKDDVFSAGFMKLNLDQPLEGFESLPAMELERIYIAKSASRKGIGRKAVEFCFALAATMNKKIVWLKSMDSSDALLFYERIGFEECGTYRLDFEVMKAEYRGMKILMKKI